MYGQIGTVSGRLLLWSIGRRGEFEYAPSSCFVILLLPHYLHLPTIKIYSNIRQGQYLRGRRVDKDRRESSPNPPPGCLGSGACWRLTAFRIHFQSRYLFACAKVREVLSMGPCPSPSAPSHQSPSSGFISCQQPGAAHRRLTFCLISHHPSSAPSFGPSTSESILSSLLSI
jgi:hypothetical protein